WEQVKQLKQKIIFVEGSNHIPPKTDIPTHISYHRQITKETLLPLIQKASIVVCRSGYSTLMDLVVLDKKAIIIPTPGQTEQEYLGNYLHREGIFYHAPQQRLDLQDV